MKTKRRSALIAGIALLLMAATAIFSYGFVHNSLVIYENAGATFDNITSNKILFLSEILGWIFILFLDVVVAWSLYLFFKNDNNILSLITACLRMVFVFIFGVAIFNLINIPKLLNENSHEAQMMGKEIMNYIVSFENTWSFALIIFGFHLLLLGMLTLKSKSIHNLWGMLLIFAAASYIFIHSAKFLLPEFQSQIATAEMVLSLPMAIGEIGFAFWLIMRGGKIRVVYSQKKI